MAHVTLCLADLALHQGYYKRAAKLVSESLLMSKSFLGHFSNREFSVMRLLIVSKLACTRQDYEKGFFPTLSVPACSNRPDNSCYMERMS